MEEKILQFSVRYHDREDNLYAVKYNGTIKKSKCVKIFNNLIDINLKSITGLIFHYVNNDYFISLHLENSRLNFKQIQFPANITTLGMTHCNIKTLKGLILPPNLTHLYLGHNKLKNMRGVTLPSKLKHINIESNMISTLEGIQFPATMRSIYAVNNYITSINAPHQLDYIILLGNPLFEVKTMGTIVFCYGLEIKKNYEFGEIKRAYNNIFATNCDMNSVLRDMLYN